MAFESEPWVSSTRRPVSVAAVDATAVEAAAEAAFAASVASPAWLPCDALDKCEHGCMSESKKSEKIGESGHW